MKSVQLSELGHLAEDVKNGEAAKVRDGTRVGATFVPFHQSRLEKLATRGLITLGSDEPWPEDFFTRPLPKADGSVLR